MRRARWLICYRDRTDPSGYKVSTIQFANGEPVAPANSNTSYTDIFANANNSVCPNNCFRPVGMAFDSQGRMFVSSDASGEVYVIMRDQSSNGTVAGSGSSGSGGGKTSGSQSLRCSVAALMVAIFTICLTV